MKIGFVVLAVSSSTLAFAGCGSDDDISSVPPEGLSCTTSVGVADGGSAIRALDEAAPGSCVLLTGASYGSAGFTVKEGVTLAGAKGARPKLSEGQVTLRSGASLVNVDVEGGPIGVRVDGDAATIRDVAIRAADVSGLVVRCDRCGPGTIVLEDLTLEKNSIGMIVAGAHVAMTQGRVAENGSTSLTSGLGVVASGGAHLELDGVVVEKNGATGLVVDGEATTLTAKDSKVLDNAERGLWVQGVAGTLDAPSVRLEGTEVARNKIVGVGAIESRGIIVVGGRVAETIAAPVVTDLATTEQVGDGLGVFDGSGDVKVDGTLFEANARAAGIIDGSDRGIIVVGGRVSAGPSGLKFVVQRSTSDVQIAADLESTPGKTLGVSAQRITLPPIDSL